MQYLLVVANLQAYSRTNKQRILRIEIKIPICDTNTEIDSAASPKRGGQVCFSQGFV